WCKQKGVKRGKCGKRDRQQRRQYQHQLQRQQQLGNQKPTGSSLTTCSYASGKSNSLVSASHSSQAEEARPEKASTSLGDEMEDSDPDAETPLGEDIIDADDLPGKCQGYP
ncbi:unnamed protein product, partial [Protopolystoma xenopodis]